MGIADRGAAERPTFRAGSPQPRGLECRGRAPPGLLRSTRRALTTYSRPPFHPLPHPGRRHTCHVHGVPHQLRRRGRTLTSRVTSARSTRRPDPHHLSTCFLVGVVLSNWIASRIGYRRHLATPSPTCSPPSVAARATRSRSHRLRGDGLCGRHIPRPGQAAIKLCFRRAGAPREGLRHSPSPSWIACFWEPPSAATTEWYLPRIFFPTSSR
jgi:hypothetical protein